VDGAPAKPPILEERELSAPLPPDVARQVIWGGARHSRVAALRSEVTTRVPILMYHRVADDGHASLDRYRVTTKAFAEQMRFLRAEGFWSVTPERWAEAIRTNTPLPGRPVMITFDDAYLDFAEHAWPILNAHDLSAVVFAIPGKVGETADWDAVDGEAAPLLGWHGLRALGAEGASIGGHGHTHRPLSRLDVEALYEEGLRSRAELQKALGRAPTAFCYPYGASDRVVEQVMAECGYELGFSCSPDVADLSDNPMYLPRIEITGSDDLETFSRKIGRPIS
jgi:peptidoglycan/xylan/chitin deacetylase (PgdA/CDA1 family)